MFIIADIIQSLAYDYTLNVKSGSYPVEFYNGWATYKEDS